MVFNDSLHFILDVLGYFVVAKFSAVQKGLLVAKRSGEPFILSSVVLVDNCFMMLVLGGWTKVDGGNLVLIGLTGQFLAEGTRGTLVKVIVF